MNIKKKVSVPPTSWECSNVQHCEHILHYLHPYIQTSEIFGQPVHHITKRHMSTTSIPEKKNQFFFGICPMKFFFNILKKKPVCVGT